MEQHYNCSDFIPSDPVSIPHLFTKKQDIEIAGFFAAILAWGQRTTILNNCRKLMQCMDFSPHDFVLHHSQKELQQLSGFVHRTFNGDDLLYFIHFFNEWYSNHNSLERAFAAGMQKNDTDVFNALVHFNQTFFAHEHLKRSEKHISTPLKNSACKRLNLYLRWMVRKDKRGVDFGLWKQLKMNQLICPLDVHVLNVALELKLIKRETSDWKTALELTNVLKKFDAEDPIKYDFALFGWGVNRG